MPKTKKGRFRGKFLRENHGCPVDTPTWYTVSCDICIYRINGHCVNYSVFRGGAGSTGHYVIKQ